MAIEATESVEARKRFTWTAGQIIKVTIDGVDDPDLIYTVPEGKSATVDILFNGTQKDA